jgi:cysteine desulfurase
VPDLIYLDHNSTAPIDPDVASVIAECYEQGFVNPASQHRPGQAARKALEESRQQIIEFLGGKSRGMATDQLVFTSGGTESDNLALFGLAPIGKQNLVSKQLLKNDLAPLVLLSAIEHPAVSLAKPKLESMGFDVRLVPVDQNGLVKLDVLQALLDEPVALVSVMLANNETGVIQPIKQIAQLCRDRGVLIHTDAVQAVGKIAVDFANLNVDALSFTAHKFAGPRGIGGLLLRHGVTPEPMFFGGFQQTSIRPGTEDVCLVRGMTAAMEKYVVHVHKFGQQLAVLRDELQHRLANCFPHMVVNGGEVARTPQTLNLAFPGLNRQSLLMAADLAGLALSTGSACASGSSDPSPVLVAMGLKSQIVDSSLRISFGYSNTFDQAIEAFDRIRKIVDRLPQN